VVVLRDFSQLLCVPLQVVIDKHPVRFFVHKRPHVDFFLEVVSVHELRKAL
jgi:TFIIF-interacting CTD phosphatase-like protein